MGLLTWLCSVPLLWPSFRTHRDAHGQADWSGLASSNSKKTLPGGCPSGPSLGGGAAAVAGAAFEAVNQSQAMPGESGEVATIARPLEGCRMCANSSPPLMSGATAQGQPLLLRPACNPRGCARIASLVNLAMSSLAPIKDHSIRKCEQGSTCDLADGPVYRLCQGWTDVRQPTKPASFDFIRFKLVCRTRAFHLRDNTCLS